MSLKPLFETICSVTAVLVLGSLPLAAQTSKRRTSARNPVAVKPQPAPQPTVSDPPVFTKKNGRPATSEQEPIQKTKPRETPEPANLYSYEFTQPDFTVPYVLIRHDENGAGTISFKKKGLDEPESDPVILSPRTLSRINAAVAALRFLDSTADYQYLKDYSHLGNVAFTLRQGGRTRTVKFNWTENQDARAIADEYRKIANQYLWQFDVEVARKNQPLNTPQLMDVLDGYLRRNEISDPKQMLPLLGDLSNDERLPLIARNHAARLVAEIDKDKK